MLLANTKSENVNVLNVGILVRRGDLLKHINFLEIINFLDMIENHKCLGWKTLRSRDHLVGHIKMTRAFFKVFGIVKESQRIADTYLAHFAVRVFPNFAMFRTFEFRSSKHYGSNKTLSGKSKKQY